MFYRAISTLQTSLFINGLAFDRLLRAQIVVGINSHGSASTSCSRHIGPIDREDTLGFCLLICPRLLSQSHLSSLNPAPQSQLPHEMVLLLAWVVTSHVDGTYETSKTGGDSPVSA